MELCVLGLGYMGLPTASLFAKNGYKVIGVDTNKEKINSLNKKISYISEPGLKELVGGVLDSGNFIAKEKIEAADVFVITVPTPLDKETRKADLKYVISASEVIGSVLKKGNLVILESTVPPNTCKKIIIPILEKSGLKAGVDFFIAHCPERAIPGNTLYELINNDRIIGGIDKISCEKAKEIYSCFCKGRIFLTDLTTAETVKLMENTYRDINIAFANELAKISKKFGINVWETIELANRHPRVNIHQPGPGVGGHCIAVDPWFLTEDVEDTTLIKTARKINDSMPRYVFEIISNEIKNIENPIISILGVAYKADVGDTRESPALEIIKLCKEKGWQIKITDPHVTAFEYGLVSLGDALNNSDCVVITANHKEYYNLSVKDLETVRNKVIIDTRNCINKDTIGGLGFKVIILGDYK